MVQKDIIHDLSSLYITIFLMRNNMRENKFKLEGNYLVKDFIDDVVERYQLELFRVCDPFLLWNECDKCGV